MSKKGYHLADTLTIVVFEKQAVFGPGLPHSDQYVLPFHITNMCAKDMSVRRKNPGEFQDWVQQNREALKIRHPELPIKPSHPLKTNRLIASIIRVQWGNTSKSI